ncbi:MAG: hypothetical protein ACOC93_05100 [Planctomycetota bacterium]
MWILPAFARQSIAHTVHRSLGGSTEVGTIQLGYLGPCRIGELTVTNERGETLTRIGQLNLTLDRSRPWRPVVTGIDLANVQLTVPVSDGRIRLPLQPPPEDLGPAMDLQHIRARNVDLALHDGQGHRAAWTDLRMEMIRRDDIWRVDLSSGTSQSPLRIHGTLGRLDEPSDLRIDIDHALSARRTRHLLALLGVSAANYVGGRVRADLTLEGPLGRPSECTLGGTLRLSDAVVETTEGKLLEKGDLQMHFDKEGRPTAKVRGRLAGGELSGRFAPSEGGLLAGRKMQMRHLGPLLGMEGETIGLANGTWQFHAAGGGLAGVTGAGQISLADAPVWRLPVISDIVRQLRMPPGLGQMTGDMELQLTTRGAVATIQGGRINSTFGAVQMQPGGTLDLSTGRLDVRASLALQGGFGTLAKMALPGLGERISELGRLRCTGNIYEPKSVRVRQDADTPQTQPGAVADR